MKKFCLTTAIVVFLLICFNRIQAQTTQVKLNQVELMKQWLGTWQSNTGKDTVELWEAKPYGKAMIITVYQVIKGKKSDSYMMSIGYDDRDDKIKGFSLSPNTNFVTWIAMFTTDKIFKADALDTFKPEIVWWKNEGEFNTPTEMIMRSFKPNGEKTGDRTYRKVK